LIDLKDANHCAISYHKTDEYYALINLHLLGVGLLMVTIWLELCTSYSSSYYRNCHHP